jgi:ribonucleotide reductase beta subunit family protein with ferritin-like domain
MNSNKKSKKSKDDTAMIWDNPETKKTRKTATCENKKTATVEKRKSTKGSKKKVKVQDEDEPIIIEPIDDLMADVALTKKSGHLSIDDQLNAIDAVNDHDEDSIPIILANKQKKDGHKTKKTKDLTMEDILSNFDPSEEMRKDAEEDILHESNFRLAVKPIDPKYQVLWDLYKKQHEAHWTAEEIDFSSDRHDFLKLDKNIQHFIKMIFAFFAGADSIVNINIKKKFSKITVKEAEIAYGFQQMMENIHGEVYADMLINVIEDSTERDELINAFKTVKSIRLMTEWAQRWIDTDRRIGFSIVAFTIFEGIMFSGAFAAIYWLKKSLGDDRMKGLTQSNNLIAKDEGMHTNFGCVMYNYVKHRLSQEEITVMMTDAVDIAKTFTQDAIRVYLIGMNVSLMSAYLEYVADRLLVYLGHDKIYNTPIPDQFQFMDTIGFLNKDNFFERRSTEYQKAYNNNNRADWKFKISPVY